MMKCPVCAAAELKHEARDIVYTYKGRQTVLVAVESDWCAACGEAVFTPEQADRYNDLVKIFQREVNTSQFDPGEIARVREKLRLSQHQAAAVFGGGVNAFSRYEAGKAKPPVALIKLLRVLDSHPELLNEIRAA